MRGTATETVIQPSESWRSLVFVRESGHPSDNGGGP